MTTPAISNYGADASGLICGFRFGPDGRGLSVGAGEAIDWLAGTADSAGFVWLHSIWRMRQPKNGCA